MPKEEAPNLTRAEIEEFLKAEEDRRAANRLADDIERKAAPLKARIKKFIELKGGKAKRVERSGYLLSLKQQNGQIAWKNEFLRVAGEEEAARVAANPPQVEKLSIEKAA